MFGALPAQAGVGIAVVLDLPKQAKAGSNAGVLTIANVNTDAHLAATNLVFDITVTPSCGAATVGGACPSGSEDPGVFRIHPEAVGRAGSSCEGTVFAVTTTDALTGEVTFKAPDGHVSVAGAAAPDTSRQCVIDFAFDVTGSPAKGGRTNVTTAYATAWAMSTAGLRPGVGANLTTVQVQ